MGYMCHDRDRSAVNQHYDEDYTADKPGSDTKLGDEGHQRKRSHALKIRNDISRNELSEGWE
ncbi:hypothetical protein F441_12077 [Phytophthora nicotianae CJ01A1]|nr:hypothetical protein F441_12077 [Phytophthora nicotianae CJ01A1]